MPLKPGTDNSRARLSKNASNYPSKKQVFQLSEATTPRQRRIESEEYNFPRSMVAEVAQWPELRQLPFFVQKLMVEQLWTARKMIQEGKGMRPFTNEPSQCDCLWFRKFQLPFKHVWAREELYGVIKAEDWARLFHMWGESGFEVYEHMERYVFSFN